jgi:hypothetical protein
MGVAPETMMGCLQPIIGSKVIFFDWVHNLYFPFFSKSWSHWWRGGQAPTFLILKGLTMCPLESSWPICVTVRIHWFDRMLTVTCGQLGNFLNLPRASGLLLPLCTPCRSPCSFIAGVLKGKPFLFTVTLPLLFCRRHCVFFLAPLFALVLHSHKLFPCLFDSSVVRTTLLWQGFPTRNRPPARPHPRSPK